MLPTNRPTRTPLAFPAHHPATTGLRALSEHEQKTVTMRVHELLAEPGYTTASTATIITSPLARLGFRNPAPTHSDTSPTYGAHFLTRRNDNMWLAYIAECFDHDDPTNLTNLAAIHATVGIGTYEQVLRWTLTRPGNITTLLSMRAPEHTTMPLDLREAARLADIRSNQTFHTARDITSLYITEHHTDLPDLDQQRACDYVHRWVQMNLSDDDFTYEQVETTVERIEDEAACFVERLADKYR